MDEDHGLEWVNFIAKELDREYDRRDLLNSRSSTAITGATTLVTLSLAVVAVAKGKHFVVTGILQILLLVASLALLLAAAVLSIFAGASGGRFLVAAADDLDRMLGQELWGTDAIDARNYTAGLNLLAIRSLPKRQQHQVPFPGAGPIHPGIWSLVARGVRRRGHRELNRLRTCLTGRRADSPALRTRRQG